MFNSARLRLTLAYTLTIALVVAGFSLALYLALGAALAGNLDVEGGTHVEELVLAAELARARLVLLAINVAGWIVAAGISYVIAGRTLAPLQDALARQRQFTAHASHELRTPLTVIKGEVDLALNHERSVAQYQQVLRVVEGEVTQLDGIVENLLGLARMEGDGVPYRAPRRVGEVVAEVTRPLASELATRGVQLIVIVPPALEASLDWRYVRHLLGNLLSNASRHTPEGGRIEVQAGGHGHELQLVVSNTGSPIAADDLPHIFTPFYRGRGARTDGGSGLGLALCDWVVRAHGGSIAARNEVERVSFIVHLPNQ